MEPQLLEYTIPFQLTKTIRRDPYARLASDDKELSAAGKIIVITGGGSGIGAAAAQVWARAGAEGVVIAGRRLEKLQEVATRISALNQGKTKVLTVQTDITKDLEVKNLFDKTLVAFGRAPDVVLANAGITDTVAIHDHRVDDWWYSLELMLKGVYSTAYHFIQSQPNKAKPEGTFININSGLAGLLEPGVSAYAISKLAAQGLIEYLHKELPTLRSFTLLPGIVQTELLEPQFRKYGHDHVDLTGLMALYLSTPRADYLKGGLVSVNWDVSEMEAHSDEIASQRLLDIKWIPILPASGGKGLQ